MKIPALAFAAFTMASAAIAAVPQRTATNSTPYPWSTGTYVYDGAGNVIAIGANVYRYDAVNRLVEATAHTPQHQNRQTYVYDAFGNLTAINTFSTRDGAAPDDSIRRVGIDPGTNRLDESQCGGSTAGDVTCISGGHDAAGNQTSSTAGMLFEYDALGMMTRLTAGLRNEQYVYDANNERVAILDGADSRISIRNVEGKVVREYAVRASQWEWTKDYVHRESSLLAAVAPTPAGEERRHFHSDHLGTPRLITDDRGFKLAVHTYWPFGAEAPGSERDAERMKFTGHERDFGARADQDLDYMHARFYGVGEGRFLAMDPVWDLEQGPKTPQSWNRYVYGRNNPLTLIDPDGRVVVGFTGAWGPNPGSYIHVMGSQLAGSPGLGNTAVFESGDSKAAAQYIAKEVAANPTQPVVLYGHSWGGGGAVATARELNDMGITVNTIITLDAVNRGAGFGSSTVFVPDNVQVAVNYYQTDFQITAPFGNNRMVAADANRTQVLNIEVPGTNHEAIDNDFGVNVVGLIQEIGRQRVLSWFFP